MHFRSQHFSRPDDLDLLPLTLKLVSIISGGVRNLSTNFGVRIRRFVLDLSTNTYHTHHVTCDPDL